MEMSYFIENIGVLCPNTIKVQNKRWNTYDGDGEELHTSTSKEFQISILWTVSQLCKGFRQPVSLPRVIKCKFPLQPRQKHYITEYEELCFW